MIKPIGATLSRFRPSNHGREVHRRTSSVAWRDGVAGLTGHSREGA